MSGWLSAIPSGLRSLLGREQTFLRKPLNITSRLVLLLAAVLMTAALFFPVWKIRLVAPQYRDGLELSIYTWKLEAGNRGQDLVEINLLNHYIGMKPLEQADFLEMQWMPFAFGLFLLLILRAAVLGRMVAVVDLAVLFGYFGAFSIGTFAYRLYAYGHNLDSMAPVKIEPFMPMLIGVSKIANFTQSSFPQTGAILLFASWLMILAAAFFSRREEAV